MVVLSRIYTKTGDRGTTALGDRRRVAKDHPRIEAYGTVDELNSLLGLGISSGLDAEAAGLLRRIQNDLFDLGADLCVPERRAVRKKPARPALRVGAAHIRPLEQAIDRFNAALHPLRSFILPGGSTTSSWLHLARTVCRRAERRVVTLARREKVNPDAIIYLNRLSDLLFVMARGANDAGRADVLWVPGGSTTEA
ncbi:MAG: ATP:cob(I)alamin adenosyltransferase [Acidobacteria bacterium 13_1_40CM_4_69_4]|nr:MAG: ATP:cob(I)alamin adenosyltransferase [Acidobacteria bacterium 13_1_40CM_4_69_4]